MYRDRTKAYFDAYKGHRAALTAICETFDKAMKSIEQYKGSSGYTKEKKTLEATRDNAIKALNAEYSAKFSEIISGMRASVDMVKVKAPTADMLAILQALRMRKKVSKSELLQAARTLRDNPLALGALEEIANENNVGGILANFGGESTESVNAHIQSLQDMASRMMALKRPNSRREMAIAAGQANRDGNHGVSELRGFLVDRDFDAEDEAIRYFGGVNDLNRFRDFVNND